MELLGSNDFRGDVVLCCNKDWLAYQPKTKLEGDGDGDDDDNNDDDGSYDYAPAA